jgi:hypothetical protein
MFKFKSVGEVLGGFCDNIVKGYLGAVSINDRGIVLKGDKVPAGKQMMEEGGTEQVSDEERKRLNENIR